MALELTIGNTNFSICNILEIIFRLIFSIQRYAKLLGKCTSDNLFDLKTTVLHGQAFYGSTVSDNFHTISGKTVKRTEHSSRLENRIHPADEFWRKTTTVHAKLPSFAPAFHELENYCFAPPLGRRIGSETECRSPHQLLIID